MWGERHGFSSPQGLGPRTCGVRKPCLRHLYYTALDNGRGRRIMCGMSMQSIGKWIVAGLLALLFIALAALGLTLRLGPAALQAAPGGPHRVWLPSVTASRPSPTPTPA